MSLPYPGGTVRNDLYTAIATRSALVEDCKTTLVAAGWTQLEAVKASNRLTGSANVANNDTVTLDTKTYTFKAAINNANDGEVAVGVDLATSLSNLNAAILLGAGSGTAYSSATTLHSTIESFNLTATTLDVRAKTGGTTGNGKTCSEASGTLSFTNSVLSWGGYKLQSATTPQFLAMRVYIFHDSSTGAPNFDGMRFMFYDQDGTLKFPITEPGAGTAVNNNTNDLGFRMGGVGQDMRFIANKYQCFVTLNNAAAGSFSQIQFGVPKIFTFQACKSITAATNASPIVITTSAAHGYSTGHIVTIRGVGGNTAANVTSNAITVVNATQFSLDGTTGNGAYTSGGRVARDDFEVLNALFGVEALNPSSFRDELALRDATQGYILNVTAVSVPAAGAGNIHCIASTKCRPVDSADALRFFNGSYVTAEPWIGWSTSPSGTFWVLGSLWGAAIILKAVPRDDTGTFDSHNWWNYTDNQVGDGSGQLEGTLALEVP